jgi:hypothetical protein
MSSLTATDKNPCCLVSRLGQTRREPPACLPLPRPVRDFDARHDPRRVLRPAGQLSTSTRHIAHTATTQVRHHNGIPGSCGVDDLSVLAGRSHRKRGVSGLLFLLPGGVQARNARCFQECLVRSVARRPTGSASIAYPVQSQDLAGPVQRCRETLAPQHRP